MAMLPVLTQPNHPPTVAPPPLGDLSSRQLIAAIILSYQGQPTVRRLDLARRGATIDDAQAELRRRSRLGAEVVRP